MHIALRYTLTVKCVSDPCWDNSKPVLSSSCQLLPWRISKLSILQSPSGERFNSEVLRTRRREVPVITAWIPRSVPSSVNSNVVTLVSDERLARENRMGHTVHRKRNGTVSFVVHWTNIVYTYPMYDYSWRKRTPNLSSGCSSLLYIKFQSDWCIYLQNNANLTFLSRPSS